MRRGWVVALAGWVVLLLCVGGCNNGNGNDNDQDALVGDDTTTAEDTDGDATPTEPDVQQEVLPPCETSADCTVAGHICDPVRGGCVYPCDDDRECVFGSACNTDTGLCEVRETCSSDDDCEGERVKCNPCQGICTEIACLSDTNCAVNEYCDTECTFQCYVMKELCAECRRDEECGRRGDLCLDYSTGGRFCGLECATVADCGVGFECVSVGESKQCVARSRICEEPGECEEDEDCPRTEICAASLACVPGCNDDGACAGDQVCVQARCTDPCTSNEECPEGRECIDGKCKVPGGCMTSRDCPEPQTYCDPNTLMCVPGCLVDDDCMDATLECESNSCVPRGCSGNYSCGFGQVCNFETELCEEAEGPYCEECDPQDDTACGGPPNLCANFQDEDGNDLGAFCLVQCEADPENACPQGYACEELQDQNGQIQRLCFRACWRPPV